MARLGTRDLRGLLDVVGSIGYDADADALGDEVLGTLVDLLHVAWVDYAVTPRPLAGVVLVSRCAGAVGLEWVDECQDVYWNLHGDYPLVAGPRAELRVLSEVTTRRALGRNAFYNEWARPNECVVQARMFLPDRPDGAERKLMFSTETAGRLFGSRERAILETVWPYLCRPIDAADAVRRRQRDAGLTPRELEMLAAVREGLTNDEIAARLVISEGTVRKHLQNASAKLGAHTRAEAAALAWR